MMMTDLMRTLVPRSVRNGLRSPRRTVRWLYDDVTFRLGRRSRVPIRPDWEVICHPASRDSFYFQSHIRQTAAELDGFIESCAPGMVFADIGAHFGLFTLTAIRYGGPGAIVCAVEPARAPRRIFRENIALAGVGSQVTLLDAAVGPSDSTVTMLTTGAKDWHMLVAADGSRPDATYVRQLTLGTLFSRMPRPPTHLKIDIEGLEAEAVQGGADALKAHHPLLFLELHTKILRRRGHDPERLLALLQECGYTRFHLGGTPTSFRDIVADEVARIVCSVD
jgi:FkbM family methyltransferase